MVAGSLGDEGRCRFSFSLPPPGATNVDAGRVSGSSERRPHVSHSSRAQLSSKSVWAWELSWEGCDEGSESSRKLVLMTLETLSKFKSGNVRIGLQALHGKYRASRFASRARSPGLVGEGWERHGCPRGYGQEEEEEEGTHDSVSRLRSAG